MILTEERATVYDHRGILKKYRVYLTYNRIFLGLARRRPFPAAQPSTPQRGRLPTPI